MSTQESSYWDGEISDSEIDAMADAGLRQLINEQWPVGWEGWAQ